MEIFREDITAGRSDQVWGGTADFEFDWEDVKLALRKLELADIGDPADLEFRLAGPDNVDYRHFPPEEPAVGKNMGTIRWVPYLGVQRGWGVGAAQIYSRYRGNNSASVIIATTAPGGNEPVERIEVENDGVIHFIGVPIDNRGRLRIRLPNGELRWLESSRV